MTFQITVANFNLACYISDRQLSARIGRAFWSRGPVAIAGVGRHGRQTFDEFLPLQPQTPDETDYASILQANLDLIQLFSNVHDVLYSGMGSSMKLMLAGNYVKFIDDFRRAIDGWKSIWGTLTCRFRWKRFQCVLTSHRRSEYQGNTSDDLRISPTLHKCICIPGNCLSVCNCKNAEPSRSA